MRISSRSCLLLAILACSAACSTSVSADSVTAPAPAGAERAADYPTALARATATGKDIVLFQRGSDWCPRGERVYHEAWNTAAFVRALGDGFVLVAIDAPETPGAKHIPGRYEAGGDEVRTWSPSLHAVDRLARFADLAVPRDQITGIKADSGADYAKQADGSFLVEGVSPCPEHDTLTLAVKPSSRGRVLRMDFPPAASLPGGGSGRAGNFAISGVTVRVGGVEKKPTACWANGGYGEWTYWRLLDGEAAWNANCGNQRRSLFLTFDESLPAGGNIAVTLACKSPWPKHIPGSLSAAVVDDARLHDDISAVCQAQSLQFKNRNAWLDPLHTPRVALMDSQGRAIAQEFNMKGEITPAFLADKVKAMREKRVARDAFFARAEKAEGQECALLLKNGLEILGFDTHWEGNKIEIPKGDKTESVNCYKLVHDAISKADPEDKSGASRWIKFAFAPENDWRKKLVVDPKSGSKSPSDEAFQSAIACVDRELADPRNAVLSPEQIQTILRNKTEIYERWKKPEEAIKMRKQSVAFLPDSFNGLGDLGWLGMTYNSTEPFLAYGWGGGQVKAGNNTWNIGDTAYLFCHPGTYRLAISHHKGADSLVIRKVSLVSASGTLAQAVPAADAAEVGPGKKAVEVLLDCAKWSPEANYTLKVEYSATADHCDSTGKFQLSPVFVDE